MLCHVIHDVTLSFKVIREGYVFVNVCYAFSGRNNMENQNKLIAIAQISAKLVHVTLCHVIHDVTLSFKVIRGEYVFNNVCISFPGRNNLGNNKNSLL